MELVVTYVGRPVPVSDSGSIPAARRDLPAPRVTLPGSTSRLEGLSLAGEGRSTAFEPVMEVATAVVTVRISLEGRWVSPPLDP